MSWFQKLCYNFYEKTQYHDGDIFSYQNNSYNDLNPWPPQKWNFYSPKYFLKLTISISSHEKDAIFKGFKIR